METFSTSLRRGLDRFGSDFLRPGQPSDHAPRANEGEDPVHRSAREGDDAEREVEREPDQPGDEKQEQDEAEDDDRALQAVRPNLLLEGHARGSNETCGNEVSPRAEKNSRASKPRGDATSSHGNVWTPVLKRITVAL